MYRAASGALVFSAGIGPVDLGPRRRCTTRPYAAEPADARMQQAQVNLLADMGAQPTTLMTGLVAATKSTDTAAPTVDDHRAGRRRHAQPTARHVTVDRHGRRHRRRRVAGVEVSTDGGATWHPATGHDLWTYTYVQHGHRAARRSGCGPWTTAPTSAPR